MGPYLCSKTGDKYISKLPQEAKDKYLFYARPLEITNNSPDVWYSAAPIGKNTLKQKFIKICRGVGITGHKTNYSLRSTAASEMFSQQVPEKIHVIQERTGHCSLEALKT